jgi:hypothetical protein
MTSGQRKIHVLMWLVLGPVAVAGLALAVLWRPSQPVQDGALPGVEAVEAESAEGGRP